MESAYPSYKVAVWLKERGVQEVAMESTAEYWKPVWMELEGQCPVNPRCSVITLRHLVSLMECFHLADMDV
jgi:hypothetical protein